LDVLAHVTESLPFPGKRLPLVLQPTASGDLDLARFAEENKALIEARLLEHGALLFRGFGVQAVESFDRFIDAISANRATYVYRSTPRSTVGNAIYTATEYPPQLEIPLHNENAYHRTWPRRLAFCCLTPAATGGETPLADMRSVNAAIGDRLLDVFEARGVRYIRHYRPFLDLSWQVVFQTDDRDAVARFCDENDISFEWLDADTLRTIQICQGTARHPSTGERVFFNQAHLFHASSLGEENAKALLELCGEDRLPRHACYGDGQDIDPRDLETINAAFRSEAISLPWQAGDVFLLDNMQVAHGRRAFTGTRKVIAALLEPYSAFEDRPSPMPPSRLAR
jgi:alpha-ketoglutarate-dependent taurine dioxygenase